MKKHIILPGRKSVPWLVVMALCITGAGAAVGTILTGQVTGDIPTTVSQAIVVDSENWDIDDLSSHAARRFVGVSDDATSFIAAAEIATGEELTINLPLGNLSNEDALAVITIDAPSPLQVYVRELWSSITKTDGATTQYLSTPTPAPLTATVPQTYDTDPNETNTQPSGSVSIDDNPIDAGPVWSNPDPGNIPTPSAVQVNSSSSTGAGNKPGNLPVNTTIQIDATQVTGGAPNPDAGGGNYPQTIWVDSTGPGPLPGTFFWVGAPTPSPTGYFYGTFTVDIDGDGATEPLYFIISDTDGNGTWDTMDVSIEDNSFAPGDVFFGESGLGSLVDNAIAPQFAGPGSGNDERFSIPIPGALPPPDGTPISFPTSSYYFYLDGNPTPTGAPGGSDASITGYFWYTGTFLGIDLNNDGNPAETVDFMIWDDDSNGLMDSMALSTDDLDFQEGAPGDNTATTDNDEKITGTADVQLGTYTFKVDFDPDPETVDPNDDARITSVEWWDGSFPNVALDADGNDDDTVYFVLSDADSDGVYENMDISTDDSTFYETSGAATLTDDVTGSDDDETISVAGDTVQLGSWYAFSLTGSALPDGSNDASLANSTWYTGSLLIDTDADANADDTVEFVLTDTDSNGQYDTLDISSDDATFAEGTLSGQTPRQTGTNDDERIGVNNAGDSDDVRLGAYYLFTVGFDNNPVNDSSDIRLTSKTWYTGDFTIDADGDEVADNTMYFALSDKTSDGLYDRIDMSISDDDFGETGSGTLSDNLVNYLTNSNNDNDELDSWNAGGNLAVLGTHWFLVDFDKNPPQPANTDDVSITARWYVGTFSVDIDGDQIDETLDYVYVDPNSNGLFTVLNLDCDDSGHYTASSPDEELLSGDMADLDGQLVNVTFPMNPQSSPYTILTDGRIITVTRRNATQWLLKVPASADVGGVQDQIEIKIAHPDDADPGFYEITGVITPQD